MNRFFGLMPADSVTIEKEYRDSCGMRVLIQAGPEGWTVVWGDNSGTTWQDILNTPDVNFQKAYNAANENVGPLREITSYSRSED